MTREDEEKLAQQMDECCDGLERNTRTALQAVDQMDPAWQDAALKQLCDRMADAKAMVSAWACAHGEP